MLGHNLDSVLLVPPDLVHHDIGVCTDCLDADLALSDLAELDPGPVASLDFDSWTLDILKLAPENLGLRVDALKIEADEGALVDNAILYDYPIFTPGNQVEGSLLEIGEPAVRNLHIRIYADAPRGVVGFISYQVTPYQVQGAIREADQRYEFLVEVVGNGLESEHALSYYDSSRINAEYRVHVPGDVEFLERFDTGPLTVSDVLLGFLEFLGEFDTGVGENNTLESYQLALE